VGDDLHRFAILRRPINKEKSGSRECRNYAWPRMVVGRRGEEILFPREMTACIFAASGIREKFHGGGDEKYLIGR
jgi:hypothetical protein